jgi:hypothetical protein
LRDLGEDFTFRAFTEKLENEKRNFNPAQLAGLEQRMSLLKSFMAKRTPMSRRPKPRFAAGRLTIIDLSDPFIDSASACSLFEIVTRMFVRADVGTGKVLVVDEAHKVCQISGLSFAFSVTSSFSTSPRIEAPRVSRNPCSH